MYAISTYHEKGSILQTHMHSHTTRSGKGEPKQMTWHTYVFVVDYLKSFIDPSLTYLTNILYTNYFECSFCFSMDPMPVSNLVLYNSGSLLTTIS